MVEEAAPLVIAEHEQSPLPLRTLQERAEGLEHESLTDIDAAAGWLSVRYPPLNTGATNVKFGRVPFAQSSK